MSQAKKHDNDDCAFIIDLLNILSGELDCFINAPSLASKAITGIKEESGGDFDLLIKLNNYRRAILIQEIMTNMVSWEFHHMIIKRNGEQLFEGWDGIQYGKFSKEVIIPEWFQNKHADSIL